MHDTAFRIGTLVMNSYTNVATAGILEIGAQNVNGSLRASACPTTNYVGVDMEEGEGVDLVVDAGQPLPLDDDQFDLVMATSVFEHDPAFWRTFVEMCRKAKQGGFIYVNAPSNGKIHRYPRDCWRFYPDAGLALVTCAAEEGVDIVLVESFIAERENDEWNDFCAVFRREPAKTEPLPTTFVYQHVPATNIITWQSSNIINEREQTEDQALLQRERNHVQHLMGIHRAEHEARDAERQYLARSAAEGLVAEERAKLRMEEARAQFELAEHKVAEIHVELSTRELRINELEVLLAQREEEILRSRTDAEAQLVRAAEQAAQRDGELATLRDELDRATRELSSLRRSAASRETAMQQRDRQLTRLQEIIDICGRSSSGWRGLMPPGWRKRRELDALRRAGLFDADDYLSRYADVKAAGFDPLAHFIRHGLIEDRDGYVRKVGASPLG